MALHWLGSSSELASTTWSMSAALEMKCLAAGAWISTRAVVSGRAARQGALIKCESMVVWAMPPRPGCGITRATRSTRGAKGATPPSSIAITSSWHY